MMQASSPWDQNVCMVCIPSLPLEGSVTPTPPVADRGGVEVLAKRAEQAERSTASIEPDGIGGAHAG
jgi:hypothetical protein